jgi:hypothetical protein
LTSSDKILGFERNMNFWKNRVKKFRLLALLLRLESKEGYQQVSSPLGSHLEELQNKIKPYFPSLSTQVYDWERNPYSESSAMPENLTSREEEQR